MTTVQFQGHEFTLPYRGKFGCQIQSTLAGIMRSKSGIALYAAMGLTGRAKSYGGRYKAAFQRFAYANPDKLREGNPGPKGGYGFRFIG